MAGDEQVRAQMMRSRQALELTTAESWQLLASVSLGRIVFTQHAMPAIRPVNHLVDDQAIIVRSHLGAAIVAHAAADDGVVVCYEADELDPVRRQDDPIACPAREHGARRTVSGAGPEGVGGCRGIVAG